MDYVDGLSEHEVSNSLVRTPPHTGPTILISMMAMGMKRAILCCRRVARARRAAGRWNTSEETAAHKKTPYHISETKEVSSKHISLQCLQTLHMPVA
jgi:hypothetical protein